MRSYFIALGSINYNYLACQFPAMPGLSQEIYILRSFEIAIVIEESLLPNVSSVIVEDFFLHQGWHLLHGHIIGEKNRLDFLDQTRGKVEIERVGQIFVEPKMDIYGFLID